MAMTLGQLVAAVGGQFRLADGGLSQQACRSGLSFAIHSGQVRPGEVFWALPGTRHNGADFAGEAFRRGACGVVTDRDGVSCPRGRWVLQVENSLAALWRMAAGNRNAFRGPVVAVTGSHGKTTTRELIAKAIAPQYGVAVSPKNYNNHVGLPLSLAGLSGPATAGVFELAASGEGEIARLAGLAKPTIGVITGIGEAHLARFGGADAIARAKTELLAALPADGMAVLNGDCPRLRKVALSCKSPIVWYGRDAACGVRPTNVSWSAGQLRMTLEGVRFEVPLWGRHYLSGVLAAIAVGRSLDVTLAEMADVLAEFCPPALRGRVYRAGATWILDDTYNASPSAMRACLELVGELPARGRRIVVCGDMLELGDEAQAWHQTIGREVVTRAGAERLIAIGQHAETVVEAACEAGMPRAAATTCRTIDEAYNAVTSDLGAGDWVAIKGSRALGLERLVARLREATSVMTLPEAQQRQIIPLVTRARLVAAAA